MATTIIMALTLAVWCILIIKTQYKIRDILFQMVSTMERMTATMNVLADKYVELRKDLPMLGLKANCLAHKMEIIMESNKNITAEQNALNRMFREITKWSNRYESHIDFAKGEPVTKEETTKEL